MIDAQTFSDGTVTLEPLINVDCESTYDAMLREPRVSFDWLPVGLPNGMRFVEAMGPRFDWAFTIRDAKTSERVGFAVVKAKTAHARQVEVFGDGEGRDGEWRVRAACLLARHVVAVMPVNAVYWYIDEIAFEPIANVARRRGWIEIGRLREYFVGLRGRHDLVLLRIDIS